MSPNRVWVQCMNNCTNQRKGKIHKEYKTYENYRQRKMRKKYLHTRQWLDFRRCRMHFKASRMQSMSLLRQSKRRQQTLPPVLPLDESLGIRPVRAVYAWPLCQNTSSGSWSDFVTWTTLKMHDWLIDWCHPLNRKYIVFYCIAVKAGPSHGDEVGTVVFEIYRR